MFMMTLHNFDGLKQFDNLSRIGGHTFTQTELTGYACLAVCVLLMALSRYRYLLWYTLAGMTYWLCIEVLQAGLVEVFDLSNWHGYIIALMTSWLLMVSWLVYRHKYHPNSFPEQATEHTKLTNQQAFKHSLAQTAALNDSVLDVNSNLDAQSKYIEHTPVYKDYQPRFQ